MWAVRVAVLLGALLRLRNWAHDRSLWLDEITITKAIRADSFLKLTRPLAGEQAAPVGWLWAEKLATTVFGVNENALRLFPLVAGIAGLPVLAALANRLLRPVAAVVAVALAAVSPRLIYYAAETKQYSTDATVVTAILLATIATARCRLAGRSLLLWTAAVTVLVWFSFPGLAVAAVSAVILAARFVRSRADVRRLAPFGAVLAVSGAAEYVITLKSLSADTTLQQYWQVNGGYPHTHTAGSILSWAGAAAVRVAADPLGLTVPLVGLLLMVVGVAVLARTSPLEAVILAAPGPLAVVLGATFHYPMWGRLALYLVPIGLVLLAAGTVEAVVSLLQLTLPRWHRVAAAVLAPVLLLITAGPSVVRGVSKAVVPDEVTAGREALQYVAEHRQPHDLVYVENPWGVSTFVFYGPQFGIKATGTFTPSPDCRPDSLIKFAHHRVWLTFAFLGDREPVDRAARVLSYFAPFATVEDSYQGPGGAGAYLLDFNQPPNAPQGPPHLWGHVNCINL